MNPWQLIRMARMARNPPPLWKILLWVGIVVFAILLVSFEQFIGWPDFLTIDGWNGRRGGSGINIQPLDN